MQKERVAAVSFKIRKILRESFPECRFSVTSKSFFYISIIYIALMEAPFQPFAYNSTSIDKTHMELRPAKLSEDPIIKECEEVFEKINEIVSEYRADFDIRYTIGKWEKPFRVFTKNNLPIYYHPNKPYKSSRKVLTI